MRDASLIQKIITTDKAGDLNKLGHYVFMVKRSATKPEVKKAVRDIYKVEVLKVQIIHRPTKQKKFRGMSGGQKGYKKAIVVLKAGQKIDVGR